MLDSTRMHAPHQISKIATARSYRRCSAMRKTEEEMRKTDQCDALHLSLSDATRLAPR